jgi:hypothetical protein
VVLLALPVVHLPLLVPSNGCVTALAYLIPFTLALELYNFDIAATGGVFLVLYLGAEAFKLSLSKQWSIAKNLTPLDTIAILIPVRYALTLLANPC